VDEKSQIQALERTQPVRPLGLGRVERRTHDYHRHGTTTLFAALKVATGRVTDACQSRHRHDEFLAFLKLVARAYPRRQLHVVVDNYATHKHQQVRAWLAKHPRVQRPLTPRRPCKMLALADLVGLANQGGGLLVQLLERADAELVHHRALGIGEAIRTRGSSTRRCRSRYPSRLWALGLAPAKPRRLPLKVIAVLETHTRTATRLDQLNEPPIERNHGRRLVAQVVPPRSTR
jgi:hypothetical protein